jgi:hypothetical protein
VSWLFVRPVFDEVTEITYDEAQDAIDYLKERGVEVVDLAKEEAVRENVERILRERPDVSLAHYDHGSEDKIWGNDDRPVIDLKNVDLLSGRQCYNNNCSSAKKLGVEAWKLKATYFGYDDVFYFTTDSLEEFKEAVNYGIKRRVDGLSWKECLEKTKGKMTELADRLVAAGKALAAACMRHDRDHLKCYDAHAPEPTCALRKLVVKLFGPVGWKLTRRWAVSVAIFFLGFGIALGKLTHTLWEVGGWREVLAPQGDYVGYALMVIGFILAVHEHVRLLKRV